MVLKQLIPCSGCSTSEQIIDVLRNEISSGVPASVPGWYKFSTVTIGPRKIGFYYCGNRGCYRTEDCAAPFLACSQCRMAVYCSTECQRADWSARHKKVCKEAAVQKEANKNFGKGFQMLSDMSITGQTTAGMSLVETIRAAKSNPAVAQRREELNKEKKRPPNPPAK